MKRLLLGLMFLCTAVAAMAESTLPFVADDFGKAMAAARQRNVPLFVEVSAPW